jgi:hypothetical protein
MLVSKNISASGIGFEPVEVKIGRQTTAELSYSGKELTRPRLFFDLETAGPRNINLDIVPFPELERFHYCRRQSDGQAISPFSDLHKHLRSKDILPVLYIYASLSAI